MTKFIIGALAISSIFFVSSFNTPSMASDRCGAETYKHRILGKHYKKINIPKHINVRITHKEAPVTMDHRPDRLNIFYNDRGIIEIVTCG